MLTQDEIKSQLGTVAMLGSQGDALAKKVHELILSSGEYEEIDDYSGNSEAEIAAFREFLASAGTYAEFITNREAFYEVARQEFPVLTALGSAYPDFADTSEEGLKALAQHLDQAEDGDRMILSANMLEAFGLREFTLGQEDVLHTLGTQTAESADREVMWNNHVSQAQAHFADVVDTLAEQETAPTKKALLHKAAQFVRDWKPETATENSAPAA